MANKPKTVDLYNANDGLFGRDGGPYLDQEQRRAQEVVNAKREEREPDFDNLPLTPGIAAVRLVELVQGHTSFRLAGQEELDVTKVTAEPVGKAAANVNEVAPEDDEIKVDLNKK